MKVSIFWAASLASLLVGCGKQIEIPLVMDKLFACEATRAGEKDNNHGAMFVWARNGRANFNFANMTDSYFAGTYSLDGSAFHIRVLAMKSGSGGGFRLNNNMRYDGEFTEASAERFRISGVIKSDGEQGVPVQMDCRAEKKS